MDPEALTSKLGQRLNFGPTSKNIIPKLITPAAQDAIPLPSEAPAIQTLQQPVVPIKKNSPKIQTPLRGQSPAGSRDGSRRSSPAPFRRETPTVIKAPSINADLIKEAYEKDRSSSKPLINLVVIGHVDAGKSTLMGRLLCDLGLISKKTMHRNETDSKKTGKSSFLYAWVLDETEEERSRGITMDIATSRFETKSKKIVILDAPGHKDFIPNMITGAAQADAALLVVDATNGEFEAGFDAGGQTREHTMLVRSLGVSQLIVVINKLDNVKWSQERYAEIESKLRVFLKKTGFKDSDVRFVPCSGLTGENLAAKSVNSELTKWYSGESLIQLIDSFKPPERIVTKPFRMSISDVFKGMVAGVSVSGRIDAGMIKLGDKVICMPSGETGSIKSITIEEEPVTQAFSGDQVVLILANSDHLKITIGSLLCDLNQPCPVCSKFEARVVTFGSMPYPITQGLPVIIHYNNTNEAAVVKKIVSELNRSTGEVIKSRPRCLTSNSSGVLTIETSRPICLELYSNYKDLGRFMMRISGTTIAAGLVNKIIS